jgi:25S rRNA (uracil2843-N3)-methyltransferase
MNISRVPTLHKYLLDINHHCHHNQQTTTMPRHKSSWQPTERRQKTPKLNKGAIPTAAEKRYRQDDAVPLKLQQSLLNAFRDACNHGSPAEIEDILQQVKGHLFDRDFATAFGKDEYLEAYAARWSPSRALAYAQIFSDLSPQIIDLLEHKSSNSQATDHLSTSDSETADLSEQLKDKLALETPSNCSDSLDVVCLGGGAGAEVVGIGGWLRYLQDGAEPCDNEKPRPSISKVDLSGIDVANWDKIMHDLHKAMVTRPVISKYASAAVNAANESVLSPESFKVNFKQQDLLDTDTVGVKEMLANSHVVTLMFTLNELYSASVAKTQRLLYALTANMRAGSLLLVVDSPGSYSEVSLHGASKNYPMQWLLDHTLLTLKKDETKGSPAPWEKLVSDDSRWFRLPDGLNYPIELEDMRYQIHLYRRHDGKQKQQQGVEEQQE